MWMLHYSATGVAYHHQQRSHSFRSSLAVLQSPITVHGSAVSKVVGSQAVAGTVAAVVYAASVFALHLQTWILKMPGRWSQHGNRGHRSPHGTPLVNILLHGWIVLKKAWHICSNRLPLSHFQLSVNQIIRCTRTSVLQKPNNQICKCETTI